MMHNHVRSHSKKSFNPHNERGNSQRLKRAIAVGVVMLCILVSCLLSVESSYSHEGDKKTTYRAYLLKGYDMYEKTYEEFEKALREWANWKKATIECYYRKASIFKLLDDLATEAGPDNDDTTLIYINAHGVEKDSKPGIPDKDGDEHDPGEKRDEGFWSASDTEEERITDDDLAEKLSKIQGNIILIIDTCYSGGFAGKNGGEGVEKEQDIAEKDGLKDRVEVLQGTMSTEKGYGHPDNKYVRPSFTNKLIEGIKERRADWWPSGNKDQKITVEELMKYVGTEIETKGDVQHPQMYDGNTKEEKIFLLSDYDENHNPNGGSYHTPKYPKPGETVNFYACASYDPDGTIMNYTWDFGDGTSIVTVSYSTITHIYTDIGTYEVLLTVTDNEGLTDVEMEIIQVSAPVGGITVPIAVPIDGFDLLAPYIGLVITIVVWAVAGTYVRHVKHRKRNK